MRAKNGGAPIVGPSRCVGTTEIRGQRCPMFVSATGLVFALHDPRGKISLANLCTLLGYACSLAWLAGGPGWLAVASIVLDEVDGRIARRTNQASTFGSELDYSVDVTLTGLSAVKVFGPVGLAALPVITWAQAEKRAAGRRPKYGSARAAIAAVGLLR